MEQQIPKFRIGTIGTSRQGKTTLLGTMYYLLSKGSHPNLKLISESSKAQRYLFDIANALELDWDKAIQQISGTEIFTSGLNLELKYKRGKSDKGKNFNLELIDYKGGAISIKNTQSQIAKNEVINFINSCDAVIIVLGADALYNSGSADLDYIKSIGNIVKSIDTDTIPFSFVVSKADLFIPKLMSFGQIDEYFRLDEPRFKDGIKSHLNNAAISFFDTLEDLNLIDSNPNSPNELFQYALSIKLCLEEIKQDGFNYGTDIITKPIIDVLKPLKDLVEYCLNFTPVKLKSTSSILQFIISQKEYLFFDDYASLKKEIETLGQKISNENESKLRDKITSLKNNKETEITKLQQERPHFKNQRDIIKYEVQLDNLLKKSISKADLNAFKNSNDM